jgi:hypothetical protein
VAEELVEAPSPRPQNQRVGRRILLSRLTMWLHRIALGPGFETAKEFSKTIESHAAMVSPRETPAMTFAPPACDHLRLCDEQGRPE